MRNEINRGVGVVLILKEHTIDKSLDIVWNVNDREHVMEQLINDLLAYSRLGRAGGRREPVALGDIFTPLAEEFAGRVKDIGGTLEIADDLPGVMGDRILLIQIFANLLDNALTYRRADVPLHVSVTLQTEAKTVTICVCDNGIGIPPEHYEKIFHIFQRLYSEEDYPIVARGINMIRQFPIFILKISLPSF